MTSPDTFAGRSRLLLVTNSLSNGGAERQRTLLARSLPANWSARVIALSRGPHEAILRAVVAPGPSGSVSKST